MNRMSPTHIWLVAGLLAALLSGCAADVGTIDRTQHNIVKKSDLLGKEYYYRQTVVAAPYASAYSTIGDQGRLERGVFEIREDNLVFYRTYEWIEGGEIIGHKSDTDMPLVDADGNIVTYDACVDGAGRILDADRCMERGGDIDGAVQPVERWIYRGAPIVAFTVNGHFDVIHQYNPTTGEKTNVIVEDTSDRQWFERDYMRVTWDSKLHNYSRLMLYGLRLDYQDVVNFEPTAGEPAVSPLMGDGLAIYKGEADEPRFRPRSVYTGTEDDPARKLQYMDFVTHTVLGAPITFYEYWDSYVPLCWFYPWYAGGIFECASEELSVRQAFLAVPEDDRYASVDYDDTMLEKFGYYRAERQHYDRDYGSTLNGQIQKAFLHPIWEAGRDEAGDLIPEQDRTPKPIVYYMSERYPREIIDESVELANQWSEPFDTVVKFYKGQSWWEGAPGLNADNAFMFLLCENSNADAQAALDAGATFFAPGEAPGPNVQAVAWHGIQGQPGFHPLCLDMDQPKMNGDLRYNILHAVTEPQQNGLLGFGPPSADPLTGRIVTANAYNYYAQMVNYAHRILDVIETQAGVRNLQEYMSARYVKEEMKATRVAVETNDPNLTTAEAIALAGSLVEPRIHEQVTTLGLEQGGANWAQARMNIIAQDPSMERLLVDESVRMLFRDPTVSLGTSPDPATLAKMSPRNWGNWDGYKRRIAYELEAGNRAIDSLGFSDPAIAGVMREYKQKYDTAVCEHFAGKADLLFDYSVFEDLKVDPDTESGHCPSVNEVDADGWTCVNVQHGDYTGNYWLNTCTASKLLDQIRRRLIEEEGLDWRAYWPPDALYTDSHNPDVSRAQQEMKDYLAGLRDTYHSEILQKLYLAIGTHEVGHNLGLRHNFTASTDAMNYPREYWDLKAGKTPGSAASTFTTDGKYKPSTDEYLWQGETKTQQYNNLRQLQTASIMDYGAKFNSEFEGVGYYDRAAVKFGYGRIVETFKQAPHLQPWIAAGFLDSPSATNPSSSGLEFRSADQMEALFKRVHYTNIPNAFGSDDSALDKMYDREDWRWGDVPAGKQEVPYRYCEGDRVGEDVLCWTRDSGADSFEIVVNSMADHEDYDWFTNGYSHDSATFWPDYYYALTRSRFQLAKLHYQWWALNYAYFNQNDWWANGPGNGLAWHEDPNGGLAGTLAANVGFGKIAGAFGRPTPGYFGYSTRHNRYEAVAEYNPEHLLNVIRLYEDGGARPMYAGWSNEGYDVYPTRAGAIYDRMAAFEVLADPTTDFIGINEDENTQKYKVSFYTMFPEASLRLLGGLMTGEVEGYGWCVQLNENRLPIGLRQRDFLANGSCDAASEVPLDPEPGDYIFPTTKYRIPMLAAFYGMSLMITDYDRSFMDVSRIFLQGHGTAIDLPDDVEKITFEHPFTGKIYVAYKSGLEDEYTPAYYLVAAANAELDRFRLGNGEVDLDALAATYDRSPLEFITGKLELVRSMHALYDYTQEGSGTASSGE